MERRYVGVILAVVLFLIVSSLEFYTEPRLAPDCGECTPWVARGCGGSFCDEHSVSYTRNCAQEYDPRVEFINPIPAGPRLSIVPDGCNHKCEYLPDTCNALPIISDPDPVNGIGDQSTSGVILSWDSNDGDGDVVIYDVYFGESLALVSSNQTEKTYDVGVLNQGTTYFWQIVAKDWYWGAQIGETTGSIWNFTTGVLNDPPTIQLIAPSFGSLDNPLTLDLTWSGLDADDDALTYDVYFGTSPDPAFNITTLNNYTEFSNLDYGTTYYWKVNVSDGLSSDMGGIWDFTTGAFNNLPTIQLLTPINNSEDTPLTLNLTWRGTDLDGDDLNYTVYFDDETNPIFFTSTTDNFTKLIDLDDDTSYYWKIDVTDGKDTISSEKFIFTTEEQDDIYVSNPSGSSSSNRDDECVSGCFSSWIGDEECDTICNVAECDFDGGDCEEEGYILFDIKVFLKDEYPKVLPGSDVTSDIVLYNFGTIRPVDVYLECAIEDLSEDRNKLDFFTETLAVAVQTSIDRNLRVPEGTAPGRYIYNCYMTYDVDQQPIYSGDLFEVIGPVETPEERAVGIDYTIIIYEFVLANWIWFVIGLALLLVIIFIIVLVKKRKKKKFVEPVGKGPIPSNNLFGEDLFAWIKRFFIRVFRSGVRQ
jgi:hypothetical protein